jgi:hypothetical protein
MAQLFPEDFGTLVLTGFSKSVLPSFFGVVLQTPEAAAVENPAKFGTLAAGYVGPSLIPVLPLLIPGLVNRPRGANPYELVLRLPSPSLLGSRSLSPLLGARRCRLCGAIRQRLCRLFESRIISSCRHKQSRSMKTPHLICFRRFALIIYVPTRLS